MSELILPSNVVFVSSQLMLVKLLQGSVSFLHLHVPLCPISGGEQCQIGGTGDSLAATLPDTLIASSTQLLGKVRYADDFNFEHIFFMLAYLSTLKSY